MELHHFFVILFVLQKSRQQNKEVKKSPRPFWTAKRSPWEKRQQKVVPLQVYLDVEVPFPGQWASLFQYWAETDRKTNKWHHLICQCGSCNFWRLDSKSANFIEILRILPFIRYKVKCSAHCPNNYLQRSFARVFWITLKFAKCRIFSDTI